MSAQPKVVRSSVVRFGLAGLGAVLVLGALTLVAISRISTNEALKAAEERARLAGHGIVEPALDGAIAEPPPESASGSEHAAARAALATLDDIVQTRVLSDRVIRVKVWSPAGKIVYSDEPQLIGAQFPPKADHAEAIREGGIRSELADVNGPENRFERTSGRLLEVYLPIRATNGTQLVYEQYEKYNSLTGNSRRLLRRLALPLGAGLSLLWLTQLPFAYSLARRVRHAEAEKVDLLEQVVTASERERERIAADLHDGVVQDLAGLTFELAAAANTATSPAQKALLEESAGIARTSMRRLRSSLVDLHPPTVHALGLADAIDSVAQLLRRDGIEVSVNVDVPGLDTETESLLYRNAQELLRNVREHSGATKASVKSKTSPTRVSLTVTDDGKGFSKSDLADRKRAGHLGLDLQTALVTRAGGTLTLTSSPGRGTTATVEVPR
jgi:two-component system, NarL family, sensor kinase